MNQNTHARFMTPAETILRLSRDILAGRGAAPPIGGSHYYKNLNYKKARALLQLGIAGQLGAASPAEKTRMSEALEKLDQLFKKKQPVPRRPPALETPKLNF